MSDFIRHKSGAALRRGDDGNVWPETTRDEIRLIKWEQETIEESMREQWADDGYISDALCDITESARIDDLISALQAQNHERIGRLVTIIINDTFAAKAAKEIEQNG